MHEELAETTAALLRCQDRHTLRERVDPGVEVNLARDEVLLLAVAGASGRVARSSGHSGEDGCGRGSEPGNRDCRNAPISRSGLDTEFAGLPLVGLEEVQELAVGEAEDAVVLVHGDARVVGAALAGGAKRYRHAGGAGRGAGVASAERHRVGPAGRAGGEGGEAGRRGGGVARERRGEEIQVRLIGAVGREGGAGVAGAVL